MHQELKRNSLNELAVYFSTHASSFFAVRFEKTFKKGCFRLYFQRGLILLMVLQHVLAAPWSLAAWQHGQTALQWEGSRCCPQRAQHVLPPCRGIKLMPRSLRRAHQLLLAHADIEKLTSSKQNKWQNATKGREWTGPNGAVFKEDLPSGPLTTKGGPRQKRGPWFESLLGNWGSYVWNASPRASDIPPCESSGHRSRNLSLFPAPQLCISFLW